MQHDAAVELLARAPMFRGLGGELLTVIAQRGATRRFSAGQPLAMAGINADASIFILEGKVILVDEIGRELGQRLESGNFLNEMAMFVDTSHYFGAVAEDDVLTLNIPSNAMAAILIEQPYLAAHFARAINQTLASTAISLREIDSNLAHEIPDFSLPDEVPLAHSAANGAINGVENRSDEAVTNGLTDDLMNRLPVQDLLAGLNQAGANGHPCQTLPEQGHDQTAFPSLAPRRSRSAKRRPTSEPASPRYGQAAGHDSNPASSSLGNSTR